MDRQEIKHEKLQPLTAFDELLHTVAVTALPTAQVVAHNTLTDYPLDNSEFVVACYRRFAGVT